jgi:glycosyltransferase involved in cell wall biosynthesis
MANKLKVLFLPAWYPHQFDNMAGLFVQEQAHALHPDADVAVLQIVQHPNVKRHQIECRTENGILTYRIYLKPAPFPLLGKAINLLNYKWAAEYAYKQLEKKWGTPHICHVHVLTRAAALAYKLKQEKGIPYVITEHWSRYLPQNIQSYTGRLRIKYTEKFVAAAAAVLPVSMHLQQAMQDRGLHNNRYEVIPNVVDSDRFIPPTIKTTSPVTRFLSVTCFDEKAKNLSGVVDAAYQLMTAGIRNFHITFTGDGKDRKKIEERVQSLNLNTYCTFTGVVEGDALVNTYQQHDVLISNSHYETFGMVIPEALSCGLYVISTRTGVAPELIHEENGCILEAGDTTALMHAMQACIVKPPSVHSTTAHAAVAARYSRKAVSERLMAVYRRILNA